jgi:hypothetical protein
MDDALEGSESGAPIHEGLAAAGLRALERAVTGAGDRSSAPVLLAADALLTYACEAAAEAGASELDSLIDTLDFSRFSRLLGERGR